MARRNLIGARILLTGASSGIGKALAMRLAQYQGHLLLTARRVERLEQLAEQVQQRGAKVSWIDGDITESETRGRLISAVNDELGGLDILVNNAGVGAIGPFATANADRLRQIMEVNFFAPVELIRSCLPSLQNSQHPLIVNIGSVLGHYAVPKKSEYCASKFALHGFNDALRCELLDKGIDVLLISPSTTQSEFMEGLVEKQGTATSSPFAMTPEAVAVQITRAMTRGRRELILPVSGKLMVWFDRLMPWAASRLFARSG